jgi:hypothetical protein
MKWLSALKCWLFSHIWSDAEQKTKNSCTYVSTCLRCGEKQEEISHNFGELQYKYPDSCIREHICLRCGKKEDCDYHHDFYQGHCQRCGKNEYEYASDDDDPNPDLGHSGPLGYSGYG